MKVNVNGIVKDLNIIDANGINWTSDFIGNWGALDDGQFTWDEEAGAYLADEKTFTWWEKAIARETANAERIVELKGIHGDSFVDEAISAASDGYNDLEDIQNAIANALDELGN